MTPSVDLRGRLGGARDQGKRQTCLSFASSDGHQIAQGHTDELSPDCLHYRAASLMNVGVDDPVNLLAVREVLDRSGQVAEVFWPYGQGQLNPAAPAYFAAVAFHPTDHDVLIALLSSGHAVGLGLAMDTSFYTVGSSVLQGSQWTSPVAHHAVLAVGCRANGPHSEILVRNSWGAGWGANGYCWCDFSYVSKSALFMFSISAK